MSISSKAKALKHRVTDKVSDALSAPKRYKAYKAKKRADTDVGIIKDRRAMKKSGVLNSDHGRRIESAYQTIKRKRST